MSNKLSSLFALSLLILVNTNAHASSSDLDEVLSSYMKKLQQTWIEVRSIRNLLTGETVRPRTYVAVTNLDIVSNGVINLHVREDYPDNSLGYSTSVSSYFVDCLHSKQSYLGITHYDKSGNKIDSKFKDRLEELDDQLRFPESPQGQYCSGSLILNLLKEGNFLDAKDQTIFDAAMQETRDNQVKSIADKHIDIPIIDVEKYNQQLEKQEQPE